MQALCLIPTYAGYADAMQTGRPSKRPRPAFGQRLHELREAAGLTQAQVADKLDISPRAYAFWERESVALRADQLTTLAGVLGVSPDELLGHTTGKKRGTGPAGKMRRVFEAASKLPRSQQEKILAVLQPFIREHVGQS